MDKDIKKNVAHVCEQNNVTEVYVTKDGNIFLPKALGHAKNHAVHAKVKLSKVSANGEIIEDDVFQKNKVVKLSPENETPSEVETHGSTTEPTIGQLKIEAAELAAKKGVAESKATTVKGLQDFIAKTSKLEDAPVQDDESTDEAKSEASTDESSQESKVTSDEEE